jgi:hypothetical protein
MLKMQINLEHHSPLLMLKDCLLPDPPHFFVTIYLKHEQA